MRVQAVVILAIVCLTGLARAQDTARPKSTGASPSVASAAPAAAPTEAPVAQASATSAKFEGSAPNPHGLSVWGALPWSGIGAGARYMMPLSIGSLLHSDQVRDNWALEFGADYLHLSLGIADLHYNEVLPVVGIMWNFWLNQHFALYPKIELGYAFAWFSGNGVNYGSVGGVFFSGDAGVMYKTDSGLTLRAEVGTFGLKAGVGWIF